MYTDMVGYTALGQRNESLSLVLVEEQRKIIRPVLARHNGKEIKTMGDAFLVEFPNALDAVRCAYDIQRATREFNISLPEEKRIHLRVGLHLGDVVESKGDISGDAVNVASRIEPLAVDGGVCLTRQVYESTHSKFDVPLVSMGMKSLKNVSDPMEVFTMQMPWEQQSAAKEGFVLPRDRIAILPFRNMSPDPNDEYFADGLTEELTDRLCQIGGLRVLSRTSVMRYKGEKTSAAKIGRELSAGALVEGSVRKEGNKVRVTAQLIDANTEEHLWSSKYDRDLASIFEVQSDVAERVAETLKVQLKSRERGAINKKTAENPDAYVLCLKGRHYLQEFTAEGVDKALGYFQEALNLEPTCALALASMGECYHFRGDLACSAPEEAYPKTIEYARKALDIDPDLAEAHAALGAAYFHYEWNWKEAEIELAKAVELKPSDALARNEYATVLLITGRLEESYAQIKMAYELDPLFVGNGGQCGWTALLTGRTEEALRILKATAVEHPIFPDAHIFLGLAYYMCSRAEDAISEVRKVIDLPGSLDNHKAWVAMIYALTGHKEVASSIIDELMAGTKGTSWSWRIACVLYVLGRDNEAFTILEQEYRRRSSWLAMIRWFPFLADLRRDPRWIALETRMGLTEVSTSAGGSRWNDT
jgi:TolB-like protein/Flp pilus assembly protein TadD